MITEKVRAVINKHVDEYIDEMRFEFFYLEGHRDIKETAPGKFVIKDSDVIIDWNQKYDPILVHPVEKFFIPEIVELFVVEFIVELELPELIKLSNFDVSGVIHEEDIPIGDPRFNDDQLKSLLLYTCFDISYQDDYPEVKDYIEEVYKQKHPQNIQTFLDRVRPFLLE